ncbi:Protein REVEILLE 1 [Phytophthora citrophthora]|uniref:Protein REVEILLE 1 n=1 Tax=Phytophthora citrophthora TaxID=4793 RepID=A0AAD9GYX9_9STRA|nr:Protein REVEILLE 1 [Phytophthora citrophthora]
MPPTSPSSIPFVPASNRSLMWDDYLATSSTNAFDLSFPASTVNFGDPIMSTPRETRLGPGTLVSGYASMSTLCGPPLPYARPDYLQRLSPAPITKRKAVVTFPLSVMRPDPVRTDADTPRCTQVGRWTKREHELFLEGLQRFGKSWKKISSLVHTRTLVQIRTHAQKYLQKQSRAALKADAKAAQLMTHQELPSFTPVAFPSSLPTTSRASSSISHRPTTVSRLDQLLQDDNGPIPAFIDEYYTSPTAIEDDLLRPLYTSEHWAPHVDHSISYSNKRRRLNTSTSAPVLPILEPLPVPDNLSSPNASPSVLLAAHETEEGNAWL